MGEESRIRVVNFYETMAAARTPWAGLLLNPHIATVGTPKESAIALRADHKTICSFDSIDDKNCRKVMSEVKRLVDEVKRNNNMMVRSHLSPDTPEHPHHPRPHSMPPNTNIPCHSEERIPNGAEKKLDSNACLFHHIQSDN